MKRVYVLKFSPKLYAKGTYSKKCLVKTVPVGGKKQVVRVGGKVGEELIGLNTQREKGFKTRTDS